MTFFLLENKSNCKEMSHLRYVTILHVWTRIIVRASMTKYNLRNMLDL